MDVEAVLDRLLGAGAAVWLDRAGTLRITKDAPEDMKELARAHKQELIAICKAREIITSPGMRLVRLPLGHLAVAYPPRADLEAIRWAMRVLRMDSMPLVINDDGLRWGSLL